MTQTHPTDPNGKWFAVQSSNIREYRYDAETKELDIKFKSGEQAYRYFDVEPETFTEFINAESKGSFFAQRIKKLEFKKLTLEESL